MPGVILSLHQSPECINQTHMVDTRWSAGAHGPQHAQAWGLPHPGSSQHTDRRHHCLSQGALGCHCTSVSNEISRRPSLPARSGFKMVCSRSIRREPSRVTRAAHETVLPCLPVVGSFSGMMGEATGTLASLGLTQDPNRAGAEPRGPWRHSCAAWPWVLDSGEWSSHHVTQGALLSKAQRGLRGAGKGGPQATGST